MRKKKEILPGKAVTQQDTHTARKRRRDHLRNNHEIDALPYSESESFNAYKDCKERVHIFKTRLKTDVPGVKIL